MAEYWNSDISVELDDDLILQGSDDFLDHEEIHNYGIYNQGASSPLDLPNSLLEESVSPRYNPRSPSFLPGSPSPSPAAASIISIAESPRLGVDLFLDEFFDEFDDLNQLSDDEDDEEGGLFVPNSPHTDFFIHHHLPINQPIERQASPFHIPQQSPIRLRDRARAHQIRNRNRNSPRMASRQPRDQLVGVEVVDLTGDDSPPAPQNARRQNSGTRNNAPRLNRSDASYIGGRSAAQDSWSGAQAGTRAEAGGQAAVIDLVSSDSDDDVQPINPSSRGAAARPHLHHHHHRAARHRHVVPAFQPPNNNNSPNNAPGARSMMEQVLAGIRIPFLQFGHMARHREHDQDLELLGHIAHVHRNHVHNHQPVPNLMNYNAVPFNVPPPPANAGPPKPPHEPPPPAPDGFTRDTSDDLVLICPSCEEELAYDPDEDDANGPPAKKARTRKDKAEHHFWAVKACGHVFCKRCYDNRKPTLKGPRVGFKPNPDDRKLYCAVDGCSSEVGTKGAWVGIFL